MKAPAPNTKPVKFDGSHETMEEHLAWATDNVTERRALMMEVYEARGKCMAVSIATVAFLAICLAALPFSHLGLAANGAFIAVSLAHLAFVHRKFKQIESVWIQSVCYKTSIVEEMFSQT